MDEFAVLGPLEVRVAGAAVPIPSYRQRALVARLLLDPGFTVSAGALAESMWGADEHPRDARGALQVQVSRLRALLGPGGRWLVTSAPGYRLDIRSQQIDAHLFERQVIRARTLAERNPGEALALYDEALQMWRGAAYAEFAESFAQPEATRLEQLRLSVLEDRIETLLAVGEFARSSAESYALIGLSPLRERPYALAMRALSGSGRHGEALAIYQRLRAHLAEELGSEPSRELQAVHLQVLRHEDTEVWRGHAVRGGGSASGLGAAPAPVSSFIGRQSELRAISAAVARSRLVTLTGPGGVGKTRLVLEWARSLGTDQPVAWVGLTSLRDPAEVLNAFLDALGVSDPPGTTPLDALVTSLRNRSVLLLVDNCEHVVEEAARTLETVLRACPYVRVVATSRERLALEGEQALKIEPLPIPGTGAGDPPEDSTAVRLLADRVIAAGHPVDLDDPVVRRAAEVICWRLDGLPLAIELTAAHVATLGLAAVAAASDPLELAAGRRSYRASHRNLRATLDWSYDRLSKNEQRLLRRLAVFPGWFSIAGSASVCADADLPSAAVPVVLAALVDKSLVVRQAAAGHRGHVLLQTVRQYAEEKLVAAAEADRCWRAHTRYTIEWAEQVTPAVGTSDDSELAELFAAMPDLRAARSWAHEHDTELALRLSATMHRYAELRGDNEIKSWAEGALRLPAADRHPLRPVVLASAASAAGARGDLDQAARLIEQAAVAADLREPTTAYIFNTQGLVRLQQGRLHESVEAGIRGWQVAQDTGNEFNAMLNAGCVAAVLGMLGDQPASEQWLARCLAAADHLPAPSAQAVVEGLAGESKLPFDPEAALAHFERCYRLVTAVGSHIMAGPALTGMVTIRCRISDGPEGVAAYFQALHHWQDVGDRIGLWITLRNLIPVLSRHGLYEATIALHEAVSGAPMALHEGPELDTLRQVVDLSESRLGARASVIRLRWQGASIAAAIDVASGAIEELLKQPVAAGGPTPAGSAPADPDAVEASVRRARSVTPPS